MSIQITVLHNENLFGARRDLPPKFVPVAVLDIRQEIASVDVALDTAWAATNSIDRPWETVGATIEVEKKTVLGSKLRSTSVGDRMLVAINGNLGSTELYEVASFGFDKVN